MAELLANSPVAGVREPIGTLAAELAKGATGAKALKLTATIPADTGLREAGSSRVLIVPAAGGQGEIVRFTTAAGEPTEYDVLERSAEETTEAAWPAGSKVYCVPTRGALLAVLAAFARLAGVAGGQLLIGGTAGTDTLALRGTSGSATDVVTWHYLLEGLHLKCDILEATTSIETPQLKGLKGLKLSGGLFALEDEQLGLGAELEKLFQVELAAGAANLNLTPHSFVGLNPTVAEPEVSGILKGGAHHQIMLLLNVSTTNTVALLHENVGSSAVNRFSFASAKTVKLKPGCAILLWNAEGEPGGAKERWRDIGATSKNLE